jgi:hypothetical protein
MRKIGFFILFGLLIATACVIYVPYTEEAPPPEREEVYERGYPSRMDTSYFYDYLSDYGTWIYYPPYDYVWIPRIDRYGWRPYSYGYWVWSDHGWTWISRFEWGWAPFHHGRWGWDVELGWYWVPGTIWAPAWVTWRRGDLYIGWAPLPPEARLVAGVGVNSLPFSLPPTLWIFVEGRHFLDRYVHRYVLPYERNITIINFTVVHTNIIVRDRKLINRGIDIDVIRQVTKRTITPYQLRDARRPQASRVTADELKVFRPSLGKDETAKPRTVYRKDEAVERISSISLRKRESEVPLDEVQEREVELLKESQEKEVNRLKRRKEEEKQAAQSEAEKKKIEKRYKERVEELKESHQKEKSRITERHTEEKKVTKKKIKKKK